MQIDTYYLEATLRLPSGAILTAHASYRTGERDERGGVIVAYSPEFLDAEAERLAEQHGAELEHAEHGRICEPLMRGDLDLY